MQNGTETPTVRFAGVTLDGARGCLRGRDGMAIPLAPKPLDLLMVLARNAGRTVTKEALLDAVWPGVNVTESSLFQAVREARRALGDAKAQLLRSVPRRGYLLDAVVEVQAQPHAAPAPTRGEVLAPPPDMSSLAVLPFETTDPRLAECAEGMVDEITSALSRIGWLFVIGRSSAFAAAERMSDPAEIGSCLGVRYLLLGSLRRSRGTLRITCCLIEAETQRHIWADHFDGDATGVFTLQDRVAEAVTGAVMPSLEAAEIARARLKRTDDLGAWTLVARALPLIRGMTRPGIEDAVALVRQAIVRDPHYAMALGLAAWSGTLGVVQLWSRSPDHAAEGQALAMRAIDAAIDDAEALAMGGYTLGFLRRDPACGLPAIERALLLNPNAARIHYFAGWVRTLSGDHARAQAHFERAQRLSPLDQRSYCNAAGLAFARLFGGHPEDAVAAAQHSLGLQPSFGPAHRALIASLGVLERSAEAAEAISNARAVSPATTVTAVLADTRFTRPADRALLREGLLLAGLPE